MEWVCCAAVPGSQSLPPCFRQGTDHVLWLHALCQLCVLYLCCVLSARAVEMLCRCYLNPFLPVYWWARAGTLLSSQWGGQGRRQLAWEVLSSRSSEKLWLPPELCNTVCLHWSGEEGGDFLIWLTNATAQRLRSAQTWLQAHQEAPAAKAKLPLLLFKSKFPPVYHRRGLKKIHSSLYLQLRWASWPSVVFDCCESCRPVLSRVQSWGRNLLPCQESCWRPRDPAVFITEAAKQKFREIPRRSGECGCACVKPRSTAACSGRVFFLRPFGATVHKCFAITSGSEMKCFIALFPWKCHTCKTAFCIILFEQLRWQVCLTSDLQMKHLLWVGNDQYSAPTSFQKISVPTFLSSATEGYDHKSAPIEGCPLLLDEEHLQNTVFLLCAKWWAPKHTVVMLNGRITKPGLLGPRWIEGFSVTWLCSAAVCCVRHASQPPCNSQESKCGAVSHCR